MRIVDQHTLLDTTNITTNTDSDSLKITLVTGVAIQYVWTGDTLSMQAEVAVQVSNDNVNWTLDEGTIVTIIGLSGTIMFNIQYGFYKYVRIRTTPRIGSIPTLLITVNAVGSD